MIAKHKKDNMRERKTNDPAFLLVCFALVVCIVLLVAVQYARSHAHQESERQFVEKNRTKSVLKMPNEAAVQTNKKNVESPRTDILHQGYVQEATAPLPFDDYTATTTDRETVVELKIPEIENPAEQVLAAVFMTRLGDMPPPLPTISLKSEADLIRIVDEMYEVNNEDDEETAELKETLNAAKKEIDKYLSDGGDINSFLQYYDGLLNEAREEYLIAHQEVARLVNDDDEDVELRIEYIKRVNAHLAEKGISPIKLTRPQLEDLGISADELAK